jgi:hypothetical protein
MIGSSPTPSLSPFLSLSSTGDKEETEKERQFADRRGGEGLEEEPNHTTARRPGPL